MDYEGEQQMEIEALEAILMSELQEYSGEVPSGWDAKSTVYRIPVTPADDFGDEGADYPVKMEILFAHTPQYPEEPPLLRCRSVFGVGDEDVREINELLQQEIEANMGMAMIYTLVTFAKEWLQNKAGGPAEEVMDEHEKRKRAEEEEEKRRAEARSHGTPVTPEHFAVWAAKFAEELAALDAESGVDKEVSKGGRLTGKQYFMQQQQQGVDDREEDGLADEDGIDDEDYLDDDDDDIDFDDDDDEGMLDEYFATKTS